MVASGVRRRDHDGLAVGASWNDLVAAGPDAGPRFVVVNATDAEPGSFVDRFIIRRHPFGVIEGLAVAAAAIGAREAFVCLADDDPTGYDVFTDALAQADVAGWLDRLSIKCVRTPATYLMTDPRAVLEAVEGRTPEPMRGSPSLDGLFAIEGRRPGPGTPAPAVANPTAVETPETLLNVAAIATRGAAWFRDRGTAVSPGNVLVTLTGDVRRHGVTEVEVGGRVIDVLEEFGGPPLGGIKAVLNGVSSPILTRSRLAAPLSWEGLAAVGASMGRCSFRVLGDDTDMIDVAHQVAAFLYVESCGWCPSCKFGGGEVSAHLARLMTGLAGARDLEVMGSRLSSLAESSRCDLPSRYRDTVGSILRAFPSETADALAGPSDHQPRPLCRLDDIVEGRAAWGEAQLFKRPDGVIDERPVRLTRW